jgi:transcriptional regulator with XRE-family HTH domain
MEYAMLFKDYGQGGLTAVPVSQCTGEHKPDYRRPYTVYEVLTDFFGEDMSLVLGNYLKQEIGTVRRQKGMKKARQARLLSYYYLTTRSRTQQPVNETLVDFIIRGKVEAETEEKDRFVREMDFRVRYILDLRPCEQKCIGPLIFLKEEEDPASEDGIPANDYLLPILRAKDYETVAHQILRQFYPEYGNCLSQGEQFVVNGDDLAARMNLTVRDVHFADPATLGQIYYNFGEAVLLDAFGRKYTEQIEPGTILISIDNCQSPSIRNSTVCHECCHMYLDRTFFLLQMMTGCPYSYYTNRRREARRAYRKNGPVDWMELQCEKLPAYLLMESQSTKELVESELQRHQGVRSPEVMRDIIDTVSIRNKVSRAMAKYRLIELGYYEAEGIRCFVDGRSVPDHGCSGSWPEGVTYTISAYQATELADRDPKFLNLIRGGRYRYVEGHFCLNQEAYVKETWYGTPYLTSYARTHIDECCLGFAAHGRYRSSEFRQGRVARTKTKPVTSQYCPGYTLVAEPGTDLYVKENETFRHDSFLWGELLYALPDDFHEAVNEILQKKGITQEALAERLGVERRTLTKYLSQDNPTIDHVVGICVALQLPFFISEKLIELSGNAFQRKPLHHQYREFLFQAEKLTVSRCEDILVEHGWPPLFGSPGQSETERAVRSIS